MKLKYYLRGLGVGIVVTAVILTIANHLGNKMSDEDIIKRAAKLGMVMKEDESLFPPTEPETTTPEPTSPSPAEQDTTAVKPAEPETRHRNLQHRNLQHLYLRSRRQQHLCRQNHRHLGL